MPVASRSGAVWCLKKVQALVQWAQTAVRGALRRARRGVSGCAPGSGGVRGAWLVRAARDGHGAPAQGSRTYGTAQNWRCACLRARGDVRAVFTRCAWRGSCRAPAARGSACGSVGVPVGAWGRCPKGDHFGVLKELLFTASGAGGYRAGAVPPLKRFLQIALFTGASNLSPVFL